MADLGRSIDRDASEGNLFSWVTRLRQPEELYFRTLYLLFIAKSDEVPHIMSGERPNDFWPIYEAVQKLVYQGKGQLYVEKPGLISGSFRAINILNCGTHVHYQSFVTALAMHKDPQLASVNIKKISKHVLTYCRNLKEMRLLFQQGKSKDEALQKLITLHS